MITYYLITILFTKRTIYKNQCYKSMTSDSISFLSSIFDPSPYTTPFEENPSKEKKLK
eukprot:m.50469 g.50469  ORF g.50469 m.50469 type:complete len:58 (-) comp7514_c0_seq1:989-1162(-)